MHWLKDHVKNIPAWATPPGDRGVENKESPRYCVSVSRVIQIGILQLSTRRPCSQFVDIRTMQRAVFSVRI